MSTLSTSTRLTRATSHTLARKLADNAQSSKLQSKPTKAHKTKGKAHCENEIDDCSSRSKHFNPTPECKTKRQLNICHSPPVQHPNEVLSLQSEDFGKGKVKVIDGETENVVKKAKITKWQPPSWRQQLTNIQAMRVVRDAPVDVMGCDKLSDKDASPEVAFLFYII